MKRKLLILYVLLSLIVLCVAVNADNEYEVNIDEDDRFIYMLDSWNEDLANNNLGSGDIEDTFGNGSAVGSFCLYEVDDIDEVNDLFSWDTYEYVPGWQIELDYWGWTDDKEDFNNNDNDANLQFKLFKNVDDYGMYQSFLFMSIVIPTPSDEYLGDLDWSSEYMHDGFKVTYRYTTSEGKDVKLVHEWDKDGVLDNLKLLTDDNKIIYEIVRDKNNPIPIIVITGVVIGVSIFGIIYALYKKSKRNYTPTV